METKRLRKALLNIVLLSVGLVLFKIGSPLIVVAIPSVYWKTFLVNNNLIGNALFGIGVFLMMSENRLVSISIGVLSSVMPFCGAIFYIFYKTSFINHE